MRGDGSMFRNGSAVRFIAPSSASSKAGPKSHIPLCPFGPVRFGPGDLVTVVIDMNDGTKPGCAAIAVSRGPTEGCGPFVLTSSIPAGRSVRPVAFAGDKTTITVVELARDDPEARMNAAAAVVRQITQQSCSGDSTVVPRAAKRLLKDDGRA